MIDRSNLAAADQSLSFRMIELRLRILKDGLKTTASEMRSGVGLRRGFLRSPSVLGIVLFLFVTSFPPFDELSETYLAAHMLQHILIIVSGVLIAYPLFRSGLVGRIRSTSLGVFAFVVVSALLIVWHMPQFWDAAVENFWIHFVEHVFFLVAGFLIGSLMPTLPDNFKLFVFAIAISAHDIYGFVLYLTPTAIYSASSVSQQDFLGIALFGPSPIYIGLYVFYSLTRETRRLEELERKNPTKKTSRWSTGGKLVPIITIILIVLMVGYIGFASASIVASSSQRPGSTVFILESPVYWQYSPENLTVVIGVNNTVTWISHSYTVDTVTSDIPGYFDSEVISSGSSFTFTFTSPGVYSYHCQLHPWMKGTITVLANSGPSKLSFDPKAVQILSPLNIVHAFVRSSLAKLTVPLFD